MKGVSQEESSKYLEKLNNALKYDTKQNLYTVRGREQMGYTVWQWTCTMVCDKGRGGKRASVFKYSDLKEASKEPERRSGSREFQTDGTAVEKAREAGL